MNLILTATLLLCFTGSCFSTDTGNNFCGPKNMCTCANFIMDCRKQDIAEFPGNVPNDTKALYLDTNKITKIDQIREDPELQTLVLTDNAIKELTYDAFDNLDNLKTLRLSNNEISSISDDIFEWNPLKLEVLYLDHNKLEFIQHFLFYDLEELTDLYLQNNSITFVHPHAFLQLKNLRNLRLDGNKLHTFNPKWVEKLQANAFTMLRFDVNPWSCDCAMNSTLKWLKNEKKSKWFLHLIEQNPITCKSPGRFEGKNLKNLTMKDVNATCDMPRITGISKPTTINEGRDVLLRCVYDHDLYPVPTISWTAPNRDIYRLNTAGNFDGITVHRTGDLLIHNLSSIDNGTYTCNASNAIGYFTASTKITVKLNTNPVKQPQLNVSAGAPDKGITMAAHKSCPVNCQCISRHVDCSGDGSKTKTLSEIPANIPIDAITISLASNELTKLTASDFPNFRDLEELRLDDNQIKTIDSKAFSHLKQLTTLTLQQNKLIEIKGNTFALPQLNVLVLDKNKLTKLTSDMFQNLTSLQWLYVRHNLIKTISNDAFVHLTEIKFIHLESNDIQRLHPEMVTTLINLNPEKPKIRKIFVDDNNIQCDCNMEEMRNFVINKPWKSKLSESYSEKLDNLFGDGIICNYPPEWADMDLSSIKEKLKCPKKQPEATAPEQSSNYSGLLFGGIVVGVVLTILIAFLWRRYGRSARRAGKTRSYNYSNLNGNDESERSGLTDNMGTSGTEAFV